MLRTLLQRFEDPKARAYLLNHFLEQFRTTCFRQTMFAEFELKAHELVENGTPLSVEVLRGEFEYLQQDSSWHYPIRLS